MSLCLSKKLRAVFVMKGVQFGSFMQKSISGLPHIYLRFNESYQLNSDHDNGSASVKVKVIESQLHF